MRRAKPERRMAQKAATCGGPGQNPCRVRPIFNRGQGGKVRETYGGTAPIPNLFR